MGVSLGVLTRFALWLAIGTVPADARPPQLGLAFDRFSETAAPCLSARNQGRDLIAEYIHADGEIALRAGSWLGNDGRYLLPIPGEDIESIRFRTLDDTSIDASDVVVEPCPSSLPVAGVESLSSAIDARLAGYLGEPIDSSWIDDRFRLALSGFQHDEHPHWLAVAHYEYAAFNRSIDRLEQAESHYRRAANLFQQVGDAAGEAAAINTLGLVALRDGRLDTAQARLVDALDLFIAVGDRHHVAAVNNNLGLLAMRQGRLAEAADFFEFALTLLQGPADLRAAAPDIDIKLPGEGAADLTWALNTLNNLAIVRMRQGAADLAERYWRNHLAATDRVDRALGAAQARHGLGTLMLRQGRLGEALDLLAPALQQFALLDARRWLAEVRVQLSILYFRLGDSELALSHALQAVDLGSEDLVARIKAARNLAQIQREAGAPENALATFDRALSELGDSEDKLQLWRTQSQRGDVALQLGRTGKAIELQLGVLQQLDDEQDIAFAARVRYRLARARMQNNEPAAALPLLVRALTVFRENDDIYYEMLALEALAEIHEADSTLQLSYSHRALELAFKLRAQPLADLRRVGMAATLRRIEDHHLDRLINNANPDAAWTLTERIRSAALLQGRRSRMRGQIGQQRGALMDEHAQLIGRLHELRLSRPGALAGNESSELRLRLDQIESRLQQAPLSPDIREVPSRGDVRAALDRGQLLLSYYALPEKLLLWATSTDASRFVEIDAPQDLADQITEFRSQLRHPRHAIGSIDRLADEIGHRLLSPVADLVEQADELIVQPHGELHGLPFAVLIYDDQVLIDRWSVRQALSTAAWNADLQQAPRKLPDRLLVLADLGWNDRPLNETRLPSASLAGRLLRDGLLARLPGTAREAEALSALDSPRIRVRLRTGREASRQFISGDGPGNYSLLHFATHGLVDLRYPALSALLLADDNGAGPALLRPQDIEMLDINARLVVLSGCETGAGPIQAGEGALSLARPFLIAGADEVVSTLWKIDDARTAEFMVAFYRHLIEDGLSTAEALAAAQRDMRRQRATAHPYYWAGFILTSTSLEAGSNS